MAESGGEGGLARAVPLRPRRRQAPPFEDTYRINLILASLAAPRRALGRAIASRKAAMRWSAVTAETSAPTRNRRCSQATQAVLQAHGDSRRLRRDIAGGG